jgi:hypothetical protein
VACPAPGNCWQWIALAHRRGGRGRTFVNARPRPPARDAPVGPPHGDNGQTHHGSCAGWAASPRPPLVPAEHRPRSARSEVRSGTDFETQPAPTGVRAVSVGGDHNAIPATDGTPSSSRSPRHSSASLQFSGPRGHSPPSHAGALLACRPAHCRIGPAAAGRLVELLDKPHKRARRRGPQCDSRQRHEILQSRES